MTKETNRKGRDGEQHFLERYISQIWPDAYRPRLKGYYDKGDYEGTNDWYIEAKKQNQWALPQWIRDILRKKDSTQPWLLFFAGDKRKSPKIDLVVQDAAQYTRQAVALIAANKRIDELERRLEEGKEA